MALIDDITTAQACLKTPFANKPILIRLPLDLVSTYNPNQIQLWLYDPNPYFADDDATWVYLRLFTQYQVEDESLSEGNYRNTFNAPAVSSTGVVRRAFSIAVGQSSKVIFDLINQLSLISNTSSLINHAPIRIIDTQRPEMADQKITAFGGDEGTIRYGRIDISNRPTFVRGINGSEYCRDRWGFRFLESRLRFS